MKAKPEPMIPGCPALKREPKGKPMALGCPALGKRPPIKPTGKTYSSVEEMIKDTWPPDVADGLIRRMAQLEEEEVRKVGLTWTRRKPKEVGFYFWRRNKQAETCVLIVQYGEHHDYTETLIAGSNHRTTDWGTVAKLGGQWAGPIPIPKEP